MSYLLVSLWEEADDAASAAHAFAERFAKRRAPERHVDGKPTADDIGGAAREVQGPVLLFGHGGASLSARSGAPGISPDALGATLSGRRVYAFACNLAKPHGDLVMQTFAERAVNACIAVFVGHDVAVMTPESGLGDVSSRMDDGLAALLEAFLDGEDDADMLRQAGEGASLMSLDGDLDLDLPSQDPDRVGAPGWSSAAYLSRVFNSVRVLTKSG